MDDFEKILSPVHLCIVFLNLYSQNLHTRDVCIHYVCTMENSDIKISG